MCSTTKYRSAKITPAMANASDARTNAVVRRETRPPPVFSTAAASLPGALSVVVCGEILLFDISSHIRRITVKPIDQPIVVNKTDQSMRHPRALNQANLARPIPVHWPRMHNGGRHTQLVHKIRS